MGASYSHNRQEYKVDLAANRADALLLMSYHVPPKKVINIYGLRGYMSTAGSAAGVAIELKIDGATAATTLTLGTSTGGKLNSITTPIYVQGATTTGSRVELYQKTADTTGIGTIILDMERVFP